MGHEVIMRWAEPAPDVSLGGLAATSWLYARGLCALAGGWDVTIAMTGERARLHFTITSSEWGFELTIGERRSWIRITDQPFVYERDDFGLIHHVPRTLHELDDFVRALETAYKIELCRETARIETNIPNADAKLRRWVAML